MWRTPFAGVIVFLAALVMALLFTGCGTSKEAGGLAEGQRPVKGVIADSFNDAAARVILYE